MQVPVMWLVARATSWAEVTPAISNVMFQAAAYILAGVAFAWFLPTFASSTRDSLLCVSAMICMLPLRAPALLAALVLRPDSWQWSSGFEAFAGGSTSDGFFQGVSTSGTLTLGTAGALMGLTLVARWLNTRRERELLTAAAVIGLSALLHPFEFIPVLAGSVAAILYSSGVHIRSIVTAIVLALPSAAAVLFYYAGVKTRWIAIANDLNRFAALQFKGWPLPALGVPLTVAVVLLLWKPWRIAVLDFLLGAYMLSALIASRLPFLPWQQHMIDGVYYAGGVVLVHQWRHLVRDVGVGGWPLRTAYVSAAGVLFLSVTAHIVFRVESWRQASSATEMPGPTSAVSPVDERAAIEYLRVAGREEDLVLAPREYAPWFATVPMHSFASHWLFSLTYADQRDQADRFFSGTLKDAEARDLLERYGIRWVVVPPASGGERYMAGHSRRFVTPSLHVYERPGAVMRPFPELVKVGPRRYVWPAVSSTQGLR